MFLGSKGQGHMDNKCIFHTNDCYAYATAHLTDDSNMAWVRTLSSSCLFFPVFNELYNENLLVWKCCMLRVCKVISI